MYTMNRYWEIFFYFLTAIFQGSSYLSPKAYGIMHRLHHAYADTEKDPHSPKYSKNVMDMMWKTYLIYAAILNNKMELEEKFKKNVPSWNWMERVAGNGVIRIAWALFYVLFYIKFSTVWWMFLLLPVHFFMGPIHGAIINWFSHKFGYVNFKVNDTSKNLLPFDFLMLGEGYHNNHHKYGGRANFGIKWHEFDPTYPVICFLNFAGIIKLKKQNDLNYM